MFHELLVALSGVPGSIFKETPTRGLEVVKNLPFVHPSELEVLNKICRLGGYYMKFQAFIKEHSVDLTPMHKMLNKDELPQEVHLCGQYLHAFCIGLDTVLQPYRDSLIHIEEQVMRDPHIPLSFVHQGLENYFFIFPALDAIVKSIEIKKIHGCRLLELLKESSNCGIPAVKDCVEKILHICHGVLYKQLSAWMLNGILLDPYQEFFIIDKLSKPTSKDAGAIGAVKDRHAGLAEVDEVDAPETGSAAAAHVKAEQEIIEELQLDDNMSNRVDAHRFTLFPSMLPSYIPLRVADKILFVGQSVQMLKDTESLKNYHYHGRATNILQGRETEFLQKLHHLQKHAHMSVPALETEIDKIKLCVAEQLWTLVVEDAHLIKHLKLLKEMYLIGRGELFLTFIDHAQNMMRAPPSAILAYDVSAAFKQSLAKILTYSEEYESLFSVTIDLNAKVEGKRVTSWDSLRLLYNPPWPLHLLFTPAVMDKYSGLFSFLLKVRRCQLELQSVWAIQMAHKRAVVRANTTAFTANTWGVRRHMAFFIDNLQYYLQVDVLETQFAHLLEKIKKTRDFETIHTAHDFFLISMLMQSFVSMKPVFNALNNVVDTCMVFCEVVRSSRDSWDDTEKNRINQLSTDFQRQSELLFKLLSSVRSHQTSPYLAQLLLRIDFNKYFTRCAYPSNDSSGGDSSSQRQEAVR